MAHSENRNCNVWAEYEAPGTSETAALCNGGWAEGSQHDPCPARFSCRSATQARKKGEARAVSQSTQYRLPQIQRPSRILASTGGHAMQRTSVPTIQPRQHTAPTTLPTRQVPQVPAPPADPTNPYLSTPRAPHTVGPSPTFLPNEADTVFNRLGKNVMQGWVSSLGWHLFDMAQQVDFFPRKHARKDKPDGSK